jgi:hypothetical protein
MANINDVRTREQLRQYLATQPEAIGRVFEKAVRDEREFHLMLLRRGGADLAHIGARLKAMRNESRKDELQGFAVTIKRVFEQMLEAHRSLTALDREAAGEPLLPTMQAAE